jgi:hypothetical protein
VADKLRILLPGSAGDANWITYLISGWIAFPSPTIAIPPDPFAQWRAIEFANQGHFVIGGLTADEINSAIKPGEKKTTHGHVVVVTGGISHTGWPIGYWGSHGNGRAGKNESLSESFRHPLQQKIHYFCVLRDAEVSV